MALPLFTVGVGPASSVRPTEQVFDFTSWSLDENLDDGCTLSFDTRGTSAAAQAIDELASDAWVYQDGSLVGRFRITNVDQQWNADGSDLVSVRGVCYRRMLQSRAVQSTLTFTSTSQGTIIWDLIDHTQTQVNGDLGLTAGDLGPLILRDRIYEPGTNIWNAIRDFGITDQPVFMLVDPSLVVSVVAPSSFPVWSAPAVFGVNLRGMGRPSAADRFANASLVLGNTDQVLPVQGASAGLATDPRGRWERVLSRPADANITNLAEYANGLVQESTSPASIWRLTLEPSVYFADTPYALGDWVTVVVPRSTVYPVGSPAPRVSTQILTRRLSGNADGNIEIELAAVEATR